MQRIEKALKLVADEIGNEYAFPIGEYLLDDFGSGVSFRNPYFGDIPKPLKFAFGTQKELDVWLAQTKDKYPLMWFVYPVTENHNNNNQAFYTYPKARLIFAMNNNASDLVHIRLQTTRFVLDQIIEKLEALMRSSHFNKFIKIDKNIDIEQRFMPNYSENKQKDGSQIDIWDAIVYDCNIHLYANCVPKN